MSLTLQRRLQALEAIRGRTLAADTPQARAVSEAFQRLLAEHDHDGAFAARLADATSIEARGVVLVDLLEAAGPAEHVRVMNLVRAAQGLPPCH